MKCIKYKDGSVKRVKDTIADTAVKKGDAVYVPKSEWRDSGRGY